MAEGGYMRWAVAHEAGMRAAASKTAAYRLTGDALARRRADRRERFPCGVKGCKFVIYKGQLCRKHWRMVPESDRVQACVASVMAAHETARKYHRRFLRQVRAMEAA